jgi:hypothetical protein
MADTKPDTKPIKPLQPGSPQDIYNKTLWTCESLQTFLRYSSTSVLSTFRSFKVDLSIQPPWDFGSHWILAYACKRAQSWDPELIKRCIRGVALQVHPDKQPRSLKTRAEQWFNFVTPCLELLSALSGADHPYSTDAWHDSFARNLEFQNMLFPCPSPPPRLKTQPADGVLPDSSPPETISISDDEVKEKFSNDDLWWKDVASEFYPVNLCDKKHRWIGKILRLLRYNPMSIYSEQDLYDSVKRDISETAFAAVLAGFRAKKSERLNTGNRKGRRRRLVAFRCGKRVTRNSRFSYMLI